jgi:hypothetical protein
VTRSFQRSLYGMLALFSMMLSACERVDDINSFVQPPRYGLQGDYRLLDPNQNPGSPVTSAVEIRSEDSGTLTIGDYSLFIPAGSVKKPTTFRMTVSGNVVDLSAVENNGRAVTQFPNGLRLTLPYSQFENVNDPAGLVLAYVVPNANGAFQFVEAYLATANAASQTITGTIYHFSYYTLAKEIIVGID